MWIKITVAHGHFQKDDIVYAVEDISKAKANEGYKLCVIPYAEVLIKKNWAIPCQAPDIRLKKDKKED